MIAQFESNSKESAHFLYDVKRKGHNVSITSLCKSMVDYFAHNENVAGSIPAEAPSNRTRDPFL